MRLNVLKVSRIFERRIIPIQILHPAINIRIIVLQRKSGEKFGTVNLSSWFSTHPDRAQITFEVTMINGIKPDNGSV